MFIYKFREVVDSVFDDHPQIVLMVVLTDLLPAEVRVLIFVVAFGLTVCVLFLVMALMMILLSLLFVAFFVMI